MQINNQKFENDIKQSIYAEFGKYGSTIDTSLEIANMLASYTNWRKRFIGYGRRKIVFSAELKTNPLYKLDKKLQKSVDKIAHKLSNAEDLTPFLSKGSVDYPIDDPKNRDIDLMLNAFNIHHFHLGNDREENQKQGISFTKRRDELLFVYVTKGIVYFINIYKHDFPYKEDLLVIIQNNWEHLLQPYEMKEIISIDHYSENSTKELLKSHLISAIEIGGKYYLPKGVAANGFSSDWMFNIRGLIDLINLYDKVIFINQGEILNKLNSKLLLNLTAIDVHILIEDGMLFFLEQQTNKCIVIDSDSKYYISNDSCIKGNHTLDMNA